MLVVGDRLVRSTSRALCQCWQLSHGCDSGSGGPPWSRFSGSACGRRPGARTPAAGRR